MQELWQPVYAFHRQHRNAVCDKPLRCVTFIVKYVRLKKYAHKAVGVLKTMISFFLEKRQPSEILFMVF